MSLLKSFFHEALCTPAKRSTYAVSHGTYVGEFFVFMERVKDVYHFLSLPSMKIRTVGKKEFETGLKEKIIAHADKLPNEVYKVCYKQYLITRKANQSDPKANNRHEQPVESNLPHNQGNK